MNVHPYDNRERRYRHTDFFKTKGVAAIVQLLHLNNSPPIKGLLYDLSFYSGGIGVYNNLAITMPTNKQIWNCKE
jgi:hypothetical protein